MKVPCLLLFGLLAALPAVAGEAYVPFVAANPSGGSGSRVTTVSLQLYNQGNVRHRATVRFVPAGEDGTQGGGALASPILRPGILFSRTCCDSGSGLLVFSGAPQVAVTVQLQEAFNQPSPNSVSVRLPVITIRDAVPAGSQASLHRLVGDLASHAHSSLGIVNLGRSEAHCSVQRFGAFPSRFPELAAIVIPPLSVAAFPDLIGETIFGNVAPGSKTPLSFYEARPIVRCDQPFYPFGLTYSGAPGDPFGLPWIELVPPTLPLGSAP